MVRSVVVLDVVLTALARAAAPLASAAVVLLVVVAEPAS